MLSVPVHKDFTEYRPKVVGSLSGRTLACLGVCIGVAVALGCLCNFVLKMDSSFATPLIWMGVIPPALIGFWSPHGMKFEEFFPLWVDHNTKNQRLLYKSPSYRAEAAAMRAEERRRSDILRQRDANPYYTKLKKELGVEAWNAGDLPWIGK